ncbi:MAG TPA: hypothetical protein DCE42_06995 [Myxococcales bacterium]|nr:hypothetical protein [Deltaproteobacteria bacterium]MBU50212.1 hypothetical protein [Deltaproteobacteria bacterium]HAA54485.1 hypothetical protein [Myxococcales bacterium]|tara:strand:+ start:19867 stop:21684 length:1818 start_codon:yes stop_codon:yes gene_type:complete
MVEQKADAEVKANASETGAPALEEGQVYAPQPGEAQLTVRAVVAGCLLGGLVSCMNIYMGLKIGWGFGGSLIAAILGYSAFSVMNQKLSPLETNITQTSGSGAGSMASAAGLLAAIPAMNMLGYNLPWYGLFLWALSVAYLGVFFAVPLRRQMVVVEKLRFPTGTATAETIMAMNAEAEEAVAKSSALLRAGLFAGAFTLATYFIPQLEMPPIKALNISLLSIAAAWTFKLYLGPMLMGAGILIGPRVGTSLLIGAIIAWGIVGPIVQNIGWASGPTMSLKTGARGWLLWPGVAIMVSEALTSLLLSWKTFIRTFLPAKTSDNVKDLIPANEQIPNSWWMGGLAVSSVFTIFVANYLFKIPYHLGIIAIALSAVLAMVATRSTGETDINPIGGMGKVTQLAYGGLAPGSTSTNLMAAAVTAAGASQAADMMQDLKTGWMLGASPRKQFISQLIGIASGVFFCIPVYYLVTSAYKLGGEKLPAPAAKAWKAVAELLAKGTSALPPMAIYAIIVGLIVGALIPILRKVPVLKPYVPSGLAIGIAFIIPAYYSIVIFIGAMILVVWKRADSDSCDRLSFAVASGMVAGEGLIGIVKAVLTLLRVPTLM